MAAAPVPLGLNSDQQFAFPDTVQVAFRRKACPGVAGTIPRFTNAWTHYYNLFTEVYGANTAGTFPGVYTVRDDAKAVFTDITAPDNEAEIKALVNVIAEDYYAWRMYEADVVYNGITQGAITPYVDSYVYRMTAEDATTRVVGNPYNGEPIQGLHRESKKCGTEPELCGEPQVVHGKQVCLTKYKVAVDYDVVTLQADGTGCCVTLCCKSSSSHSSSNCCDAILLSRPCGGCTIAPKQVSLRYAQEPSTGGLGSCDCSDEPLQKTQSLRDNGIILNNVGGCQWHGVNGMATFDLSSGFDASGQNIQYTLITSSGCSGGTYVGNQTSQMCLCSTGADLAYVNHSQCNAIPLAYSITAIHKCKSGGCTVCK